MEADISEPGHVVLDDVEIVMEVLEYETDHHEENSDEEAATSPHVTASEVFNVLDITWR